MKTTSLSSLSLTGRVSKLKQLLSISLKTKCWLTSYVENFLPQPPKKSHIQGLCKVREQLLNLYWVSLMSPKNLPFFIIEPQFDLCVTHYENPTPCLSRSKGICLRKPWWRAPMTNTSFHALWSDEEICFQQRPGSALTQHIGRKSERWSMEAMQVQLSY